MLETLKVQDRYGHLKRTNVRAYCWDSSHMMNFSTLIWLSCRKIRESYTNVVSCDICMGVCLGVYPPQKPKVSHYLHKGQRDSCIHHMRLCKYRFYASANFLHRSNIHAWKLCKLCKLLSLVRGLPWIFRLLSYTVHLSFAYMSNIQDKNGPSVPLLPVQMRNFRVLFTLVLINSVLGRRSEFSVGKKLWAKCCCTMNLLKAA